jgi:hypothetical protein
MRNRLIVFRRYASSSPTWCCYDFIWIFIELTKIVLFEGEKLAKLRNVFRGLMDGLLGRMNKAPQPLAPGTVAV